MYFFTEEKTEETVPIIPLDATGLDAWLQGQDDVLRRWVASAGFDAKPGGVSLVAGPDGSLGSVLAGCGPDEETAIWDFARLPDLLPGGVYRIEKDSGFDADKAALGWALGSYVFGKYKERTESQQVLVWPKGCDRARVEAEVRAVFLARDLINMPASDLGPKQLAAAAARLAGDHGAEFQEIVGAALLEKSFPAIHAVGRASAKDRAPRLIDFVWGEAGDPKVTLVGKGVCFDTGGLDLKPSSAMKLMKKDMGGAANVLGLAHLIMAARIPVRLRVLIPAVENSLSASSLRPLDVIATRKGLTVEIGNTDAEGRVVLADALAEAEADGPDLLIDMATLTGAARVALGTEVPAFFCDDDILAGRLMDAAAETSDPLWRLPLWKPYRKQIESAVADLTNAPDSPYGGAITAALFLAEFVDPGRPWIHVDLMAWNMAPKPGRPEGGEAMGIRALFRLIRSRFDA